MKNAEVFEIVDTYNFHYIKSVIICYDFEQISSLGAENSYRQIKK